MHYLACDRSGACAAFEHIGGKQVVTPGARALTNHPYAESVAWASRGRNSQRRAAGSLERFARAARQAAVPPAGDLVTAAFGVLDGVRWSESQWNIVYDPVHLRVSFRTRVNRAIRTLDLGKGGCVLREAGGAGRHRHRPQRRRRGPPARVRRAINRSLVERSLRRIRSQLPAGAIDMMVSYPSALSSQKP